MWILAGSKAEDGAAAAAAFRFGPTMGEEIHPLWDNASLSRHLKVWKVFFLKLQLVFTRWNEISIEDEIQKR